jgi:hypothetical protein
MWEGFGSKTMCETEYETEYETEHDNIRMKRAKEMKRPSIHSSVYPRANRNNSPSLESSLH